MSSPLCDLSFPTAAALRRQHAGSSPIQPIGARSPLLTTALPGARARSPLDDRIARLRRLVEAYDSGLDDPLTPDERAALPLSLARQPLWWVGRWLALLDDEARARRGLPDMAADVEWALQVARDAERWQAAFAS